MKDKIRWASVFKDDYKGYMFSFRDSDIETEFNTHISFITHNNIIGIYGSQKVIDRTTGVHKDYVFDNIKDARIYALKHVFAV